jgi:uncharacterized protein
MMQDSRPFYTLTETEDALDRASVSGDDEQDYRQLLALLRKERELDHLRIEVFDRYRHGSDEANDYLFREYMVRHRVTKFALGLDRKITDKVTGELAEEKSVVAMCVRHRETYPEPVKKVKNTNSNHTKSMNILVIADRRPRINISEVVRDNNIDLIVTLGDLTREDILQVQEITHIPKIGVYGNHDSGTYMHDLGIWDMHLKIWEYRGIRFGGFQGCVRYKENPDAIMYTQEEAERLMESFPQVDVFLCHCPPRGINDEEEIAHQGFDALRNYIERQPPKLLMHGHTYPADDTMIKQHGSTRIEYVFEYKIITI